MSGTGHPVTDLTPEEFVVTEDGVASKVVSARIGTEPMKIAVLVDNGERTRASRVALNPIRDGVAGFVETLAPQHLVSLLTIGGTVRRRVDFTADRGELTDAAHSIFPDRGRGVRMLDGLKETWERRFDGNEAWPVFVMVLTDGSDTSAFMNDDRYLDFVTVLRQAGVMIHTVQITTRGRSAITGRAINLAENTGGRYTAIASPTALVDELITLATDMDTLYDEGLTRYRVVYERPDSGGARVSLSVTRPGVDARLFGDRRLPR